MTQLYEGMFLLDNQAVRADWSQAKSTVTDLLAKHGATVKSARRWDERRLAYPIKGRKRATYLLTYFEQDGTRSDALRHDLDIEERVLRYLILSAADLPAGELEASQAELEAGFSVPPPPTDDEPQAAAEPEQGSSSDDDSGEQDDSGDDSSDADSSDDDSSDADSSDDDSAKESQKDKED